MKKLIENKLTNYINVKVYEIDNKPYLEIHYETKHIFIKKFYATNVAEKINKDVNQILKGS